MASKEASSDAPDTDTARCIRGSNTYYAEGQTTGYDIPIFERETPSRVADRFQKRTPDTRSRRVRDGRFRSTLESSVSVPQRQMTTVDKLWYLADEAEQQAQQTYHRLTQDYGNYLRFETTKHVSRRRFRTIASRIRDNGAPYGAHTITYREDGALLLVRHEAVGLWVLPGGETSGGESFRSAAERELHEEAGIDAEYGGLGLLVRVNFSDDDHSTWGVLPVFEAKALSTDPVVSDPDEEISDAQFFLDLPEDTRDRTQLERWRDRRFTDRTP